MVRGDHVSTDDESAYGTIICSSWQVVHDRRMSTIRVDGQSCEHAASSGHVGDGGDDVGAFHFDSGGSSSFYTYLESSHSSLLFSYPDTGFGMSI